MKNNCNTQYKCKKCSSYIKDISYCVDCDSDACEIVYQSDCVVFTGNDLECYGIDENETLTNVLLKLLNFIYGDCKLCVTFKDEDGALLIKTLQPGTTPLSYNGKVWYGDVNGLAIYWNSGISKWVCDLDGLGGGSYFQTLDNADNNLPITTSTNAWTPSCDTSLTKPICNTVLGTCPENMCFKYGYITSSSTNINENPQGSLYNGKPWYVINAGGYYLYIYWDDEYIAGPAWVVGYSTSSSATLPISNNNIWSYSLIPSDTPNDCVSNCPNTNIPWTNTGNEEDDWFFIAVNRGECTTLSCNFTGIAVIEEDPCLNSGGVVTLVNCSFGTITITVVPPTCPETYLYNQYAVNDVRGIAPAGWHVPTLDEWQTLFNTDGDTTYAFIDPLGWAREDYYASSIELTNSSGLSLRWNGNRRNTGIFDEDYESYYWTSDPLTAVELYGCCGDWDDKTFNIYAENGYAVRLVKDDDVDPGTYVGNDGTVYPTVKIGNQVWIAADLQETKYANGDVISYVAGNTAWSNLETGARVRFNNKINCNNSTELPCIIYRFINESPTEECVFEYTLCDGVTVVEETLPPSQDIYSVCSFWNSVNIISGELIVEYIDICTTTVI